MPRTGIYSSVHRRRPNLNTRPLLRFAVVEVFPAMLVTDAPTSIKRTDTIFETSQSRPSPLSKAKPVRDSCSPVSELLAYTAPAIA